MRSMVRTLKEVFKWTAGFVLLGLIVAFLAGTFDTKIPPGSVEAQPLPAEGEFQPGAVVLIREPALEEVPSTVAAKHETAVSSRILAGIQDVLARAGDTVESGSPLVTLDSRDLLTQERQAVEGLTAAQAQLDEAAKEFERSENLLREGTIARTQYDTAESAYRVALAQVDRAKQSLEEARVSQTYAQIVSPIRGRVIDRLAEPGDTAVPGVPLLKLYDPTELRMEAYVRESVASTLKRGDPLQAVTDANPVPLLGKIEEIVPQADPGSRSLLVKVALPMDEGIYPGMFGRVLIHTGTAETLYVPEGAVRTVGQIHFVTLLENGSPSAIRLIKLGDKQKDGLVSVISGLREGDAVAVYPAE